MENLQVIVTDVDGTLLNSEHHITKYTRDVLIQLQQQGKSVVLASGRDIKSLINVGKKLNISQYPQSGYISLNGLEIYDYQGICLHKEKKLTREDAVILNQVSKQVCVDMILFFDEDIYMIEHAQTRIMEEHFLSLPHILVNDIDEIPELHFNNLKKIAFLQLESYLDQNKDLLNNLVQDQYEITRVEEDWIEINPLGISKGQALKTYSHLKQVPLHKIISFGNGENDISMIHTAGIGIAMGNAFSHVKESADDVCLSHDHDGIGVYLEKYIR